MMQHGWSDQGRELIDGISLMGNTPLPPQKVTLGMTDTKMQLIDFLCQHINEHSLQLPVNRKLVVTGIDPVRYEINKCLIIDRTDMCTPHEEANLVIVQQMVKLATCGTS